MIEKRDKNRFLIVTGMSGAGKTSVLKMLEDDGFFCVDNLPARFLSSFIGSKTEEGEPEEIGVGIDIRNRKGLSRLLGILPELKASGAELLFLEASDESLIRRYKETRRLHPLSEEGRVDKAILLERERLADIKKNSDYIIDTSRLLVRELRSRLSEVLLCKGGYQNFVITLLSFGFKYGIPVDADLVFDVRFLPNPFYIEELKSQTGNDKAVYDFVMECEAAQEFLNKMVDMLTFLIPKYKEEGKTNLVVGIGCTGGKHRSVTLVNALHTCLQQSEYSIRIEHREID